MNKEELIKKLQEIKGNPDIFIAERKTEFSYGLVNSIYLKKINLMEEPQGKVLARENVIVIDEE